MRGRLLRVRRGLCGDQRQLQLESRGAGGHDRSFVSHGSPIGSEERHLPPAHPGGRRDAGAGAGSASLHREAGRAAAAQGLDCIVAVQGHAAEIVNGAIGAGMPASQALFFGDSSAAAEFLADFVRPGDLLLVKGSRGVKMERIVEALAGEISAGRGSCRRRRRGLPTEMLYYLVYHVSAAPGAPAQRLSLHHRAHGARQPLGSVSGADPGALDDPAPAAIADRPVHSRRRAQRSHQAKAGTPTMGGILIVTVTLVPTLFWADLSNAYVLLAIFAMLAFGAIGFADDLQQSGAPPQSWPHRPVEAPLPDPGELRGGAGAAFDDRQPRHLLHAADRAVLQELSARPGGAFAVAQPLFLAGWPFCPFWLS